MSITIASGAETESASVEVDGAEIRKRRKLAGYNLRQFAEKIGIDLSHVGHIEHQRRRPGPEVFVAICDGLGIPSDQRHVLLAPPRPSEAGR